MSTTKTVTTRTGRSIQTTTADGVTIRFEEPTPTIVPMEVAAQAIRHGLDAVLRTSVRARARADVLTRSVEAGYAHAGQLVELPGYGRWTVDTIGNDGVVGRGDSPDLWEEAIRLLEEAASLLQADTPNQRLAVLAGICDKSYDTVANGRVRRFSGTVAIKMASGRVFVFQGYGPEGDERTIRRQGGIDIKELV